MIEGVDVSNYQGTINWAATGKGFAWCKATEGTGYADPTYARNASSARAAGIPNGPYHFAQPYASAVQPASKDGADEADWFLSHISPMRGDLIPVLDLEVSNGLSAMDLISWVTAWVTRVHDAVGDWPAIYTSPSFWSTHLANSAFAANLGCPLWVAHWGVTSPTVPASNWGGHGWSAWQYSNYGTVPGISGRVDLDRAPSLAPLTYGGDMNPLHITSDTDSMVQLGAGTQLYNPDGTTLVKVSVAGSARLSPYEVSIGTTNYRVISITTGGVPTVALARVADVTLSPVPPPDCSAAVSSATDPLKAQITNQTQTIQSLQTQIAALQAQLSTAAADERKRIADAAGAQESARISSL